MKSITYIIIVSILLASIGQVASDLYLPSLPAITHALHTSINLTQTTVFIYMIGFSVSRLFFGPLSDAIGRRKPLIIGLIVCLVGSIICVSANSITILIIGRLLQGIGGGAGVVLCGAIIRDSLEGHNLAEAFSYMSMANIVLIASAPLLGGYLQHFFGWRASFIFILLYTTALLAVIVMFLAETNKHKTIANLKPAKLKANILTLFTSREFLVYSICIFLSYAGIMAWFTLGPVLLQMTVGFTPIGFGWVAVLGGFAYAIGCFTNGRIVRIFGINKMITVGASIYLFSGILMLFFALLHIINGWVIVVPIVIFVGSNAFIFPNVYAGALTPFAKFVGIAAAVLGTIQILGGVISSGIMTIAPDDTQLPLAITLVVCGLIALFAISSLPKKND